MNSVFGLKTFFHRPNAWGPRVQSCTSRLTSSLRSRKRAWRSVAIKICSGCARCQRTARSAQGAFLASETSPCLSRLHGGRSRMELALRRLRFLLLWGLRLTPHQLHRSSAEANQHTHCPLQLLWCAGHILLLGLLLAFACVRLFDCIGRVV